MKKKGNRDEIVLATKFTTGFTKKENIKSNFQGNHAKSLKISVDRSLEKLQTDYIDLLYVSTRPTLGAIVRARADTSRSTGGTSPPQSQS